MEKPLYILIFLLLWSTRIRGGEEEDIDGTLSPSTQKNGDRNSLIDKASSSTITKTSTIFDPDSESSETESSKTESKALETNTGTEEPSVANYVTPKPARASTIANTTTLTIPDSDSSEIQSSPIKPEAPKTTNASTRTGTKTTLSNLDLESSETDFASVKSEATEIKPGSLETDSPPNKSKEPRTNTDSTTAKTTSLSNPDSESSNTKSPPIKSEAPDTKNESSKPYSPTIRSEAQETKTALTKTGTKTATIGNFDLESSETDSVSIKSEAPETEIDTQSPSIHTFESPELANASTTAKTRTTTIRDADSESSETDSPPNKSADSESNPVPTAKAKTATTSDPNADNPEPSIINFETLGPSKELSVTDSLLNRSEAQETRTENSDRELPPRHTRTSRATKENSKTKSPPNQRKAAKATERKGPQSTIHMNEDLTTSASTPTGTKSRSLGNLDSELPVTDSLPIGTEARETKTENPDEEFSTRQTRTSRATKARESKDPQSTTNMNEDITTSDVDNLTCSSNQSDYFKNQTNSSVTLTLSPFGNHSQLCILKWSESNVSQCVLSNSSSDITIHGLDSGRPYNFSVYFLKDNKTHLSKSSCTVGPYYTRPKRPDCSEFNQTEPKITNTTITFGKNFISNNLCANVTSMKNKSDWRLVLSKSIGGLSAATSYQILLFKYLNGSDGPILSAESCPLGVFHTLPKGPDCHVIPNKTSVTNRTSKSITLNTTRLKNLSEENQLCVQIYSNTSKCNPVGLITMFDDLNSSSNYSFKVFSYYNVSGNGPKVLSEIRCPFGNYYTLPANPNCDEIEKNVTVENRTATSITLDFTKVAVDIRESLCVKPQYNVTCIHYSSPTMNFKSLNISESYNFSVHYYLDNPFLLSHNSCKISNYTGPDIPKCEPYIVSNRTTTSMLLDLRNLNTTGAERFIAEIFNDASESKEIRNFNKSNNYLENITNLTPGTAYTLRIFAVSEHNIRSADSCHLKPVYTYPSQPIKENYKVHSHSLQFSWRPPIGKVDSYNLTIHCHCSCCSCSKNYSHSASKSVTTANVTELQPGTYCSVNITAISGGLSSIPLKYKNIETTEIAPGEVSDVMVTDIEYNGFTISWSKPSKPNGDLINYNVNLFPPARTINVSISSPSTSFNNSNPGVCYNVTVAAVNKIDEGKRIYRTVYTTETVPSNVTNLVTLNTSSTSIAVTWSKPHNPNGVIRSYQIFVRKTNEQEEGNNLKQIITLRCGSCQRPCPNALTQDNLQKSSPPYVNKEKDEKTTVHEVSFTESNTTLHYEVTGLEIFTSYTFNVTAFTSVGHGEWETNVGNTSEDIPSSVTDLTSSNTSSTSIAVTWSKPQNPNGVIRSYQIFVRKTNEQEEGNNLKQIITLKCDCCQRTCPTVVPQDRLQESSPPYENKGKDEKTTLHEVYFTERNTTLYYEVTGLEIFTSYTFNVTAFTSVGHGKWETNVGNTSEDKPSTPGPPVESNVQIGNLSFVYNKPEKENGVITNQEIEYSYKPYYVCAEDSEYEHNVTKTNTTGIIDNGDKFNASLENLQPFWRYTIRVRVSTYAGFSNYSQPTTIQTLPTTPEKVVNIKAAQTFSRRIDLRWAQPCQPNGLIINYTIGVSNRNDSSNSVNDIRFTNNSRTSFNVIHLLPYRSYQFTVRTQVEGVTQLSTPQISIFQTTTEAPYPLGNITVNITSTSVTLLWKAPELETGPTNYIVTAIDNETSRQNGSCKTQGFYNTSCSIHGLDAYWPYLLIVYVKVEDFPEKNKTIDIRTLESAPGRVSRFTVTQDPNVTAETNVHIEWSPPVKRDLNGVIQTYFIKYWYQPNKETILSFDQRRTKASVIVQAEERYTFQIFAQTTYNATEKDYLSRNITINPGAPIPPPKQKVPLINKGPPASDDQTQIAVAFSQAALCKNSNGKINKWYIIVSKMPEGQVFIGARKDYLKKIEKIYKKWEDVYEKDVNDPYIASDTWNPHCESGSRRKRSAPLETISYTLGSDGDCESGNRKYCNGNLEPGQTYRVRYAVCTNGGCLESEFSEPFQTAPNHVPAIAGSLTAVVLVLAVIIVVIIILKRRGKGPFKSLDNGEMGQQNEAFAGVEMKGAAKPKAVKIADFANYVQKLHADSNLLFSSEYKLLKETCPTHTTKAAEVQVNRIKNRYTNILSYDHSRVKLLPTEDDEGSDYINANYMPGYTSPREYIATQGPLPFTRDDFWRMIWEQNVSIIVMLTQLVERGRRKCDIYWPEASREPVYYGDLVVELESESTLPDYVLRVMSIKLGNRVRKVKQLHYLKWPDMGCPETTWLLLNFVGATRLYLPHNDPGPIVVHCSAGVGRTGTFIAVDYLMQHVRTSDVIDIYSYVMKMRNNRPNMVQTEDQYVFIHDCIKDYVNKNDDDTDDEEEEEEKQENQSIYMNV